MARTLPRRFISVEADAPAGFEYVAAPGRRELRGGLVAVWCARPQALRERLGSELGRLRGVILSPDAGSERLGPSVWQVGVERGATDLWARAESYLDICAAQVEACSELSRVELELERERTDRQRLGERVDVETLELRQRLFERSQWTVEAMTALVHLVAQRLPQVATPGLPEVYVDFLTSAPLRLASASMWCAAQGGWQLGAQRGEADPRRPAGSGEELRLLDPHCACFGVPVGEHEGAIVVTSAKPLDEAERSFLELFRLELGTHHHQRQLHAALSVSVASKDALIAELSTPVIQIWHDAVCLPLIGSVDRARGEQISSSLLEVVAGQGVRHVLLDLTGLASIDTSTAALLSSLARTLALLGARCSLTGISPAVARTLVGLGAQMAGVRTLPSLAAAIREHVVER